MKLEIHDYMLYKLSPMLRNIRKQIWRHKNGQSQPSVIIWTNLVVLAYPKLYTKFQGHWSLGAEEGDFLKVFTIYGPNFKNIFLGCSENRSQVLILGTIKPISGEICSLLMPMSVKFVKMLVKIRKFEQILGFNKMQGLCATQIFFRPVWKFPGMWLSCGPGNHLGHVTRNIWINFHPIIPWRLQMKFGFKWPWVFWGKEVWKCWIWVTLNKCQWMTLTFGSHKTSCTHLFGYNTNFHLTGFNSFLEIFGISFFPYKNTRDQIWPCCKIG